MDVECISVLSCFSFMYLGTTLRKTLIMRTKLRERLFFQCTFWFPENCQSMSLSLFHISQFCGVKDMYVFHYCTWTVQLMENGCGYIRNLQYHEIILNIANALPTVGHKIFSYLPVIALTLPILQPGTQQPLYGSNW